MLQGNSQNGISQVLSRSFQVLIRKIATMENKEEAEAFIAHVEEVIVSVSLTYLWHRFYDCIRFKCCILCEHYELHSNLTINGSPINNMECKLCKQIWSKSHSHYDSCVRNTAQFSSCDFCELFTDIEYQKVRIKPGYHLKGQTPSLYRQLLCLVARHNRRKLYKFSN